MAVTTTVPFSQTVSQGVTSVAPPKVAATNTFGQAIVLNTTLKATSPASVKFSGTATITDAGNNVLGTATVATNGAVKITLDGPVAPGTYVCTLSYAGDTNHTSATSSTFTLHVLQSSTTTVLKADHASTVAGESVTLTATVGAKSGASTARTGTVTFFDGLNQVGDPVALSGSSIATLVIDNPSVGPHNYTAVYSGDSNFLTSTSVKSVVTVKKAKTTTTLTPSAGTSAVHDVPFDLTAAVALVAPGAGAATGSVVFKEGSTVLGTIALDGAGHAVLTGLSLTSLGTHKITATYSGDTNGNPSTSTVLVMTVT
jgi:hypothetical protein